MSASAARPSGAARSRRVRWTKARPRNPAARRPDGRAAARCSNGRWPTRSSARPSAARRRGIADFCAGRGRPGLREERMNMRGRRFEVDRANGKIAGRLRRARPTRPGVDATIFRIGFVLATVLGGFPWTLIAYAVPLCVGQPEAGPATRPARSPSAARKRASGCAAWTSGCRRSRPMSPARTAGWPARSRSFARIIERHSSVQGGQR